MAPPSSVGQTIGPAPSGTKGPAGLLAVADPMHWVCVAVSAATKYITYFPGANSLTSGAQVLPGLAQPGRFGSGSWVDAVQVARSREVAIRMLNPGPLVAYAT